MSDLRTMGTTDTSCPKCGALIPWDGKNHQCPVSDPLEAAAKAMYLEHTQGGYGAFSEAHKGTQEYWREMAKEAVGAATPHITAPLLAETARLTRELEEIKKYPRRPEPQGMTLEDELAYWRRETLTLDTWHDIQNKRVADAEAHLARAREEHIAALAQRERETVERIVKLVRDANLKDLEGCPYDFKDAADFIEAEWRTR